MNRPIEKKDEIKKTFKQHLVTLARNTSQNAAMGNDNVMSQPYPQQQQQQGMPGVDGLKSKWKQHVGSAKIAWGKLTDDELLKSEGHAQKLTGLVQERYAISRNEAGKQVKNFIEKHII